MKWTFQPETFDPSFRPHTCYLLLKGNYASEHDDVGCGNKGRKHNDSISVPLYGMKNS